MAVHLIKFYIAFFVSVLCQVPDAGCSDNETTQDADVRQLKMDRAYFTVTSGVNFTIHLWMQNGECYKCPLLPVVYIGANRTERQTIQTKYGNHYAILREGSGLEANPLCREFSHFKEYGDYWLYVNKTSEKFKCKLILRNNPENSDLPVLYMFLILVGLTVLWLLFWFAFKKGIPQKVFRKKGSVDIATEVTAVNKQIQESYKDNDKDATTTDQRGPKDEQTSSPSSSSSPPPSSSSSSSAAAASAAPPSSSSSSASPTSQHLSPPKKRLRSLDTFRGLCLTIMIFVNYGGGGYHYFEHIVWNGLTIADFVYPWFVFIMGSAIALSLRSLRKKKSLFGLAVKITWRFVILFAIGLCLGARGHVDLTKIRIPGVLQRLAVAYFGTAIIHMFFSSITFKSKAEPRWWIVRDILPYWLEWGIQLAILAVYLGITFGLQVPGCPTGYLGPGGLHDGGRAYNCSGGAAGYIDRLILTKNHMYNSPTYKEIYMVPEGFDPEGILGTLSCIFLCFLGVQAGKIVVLYQKHSSRLVRWVAWGLLTSGLGTLLCKASKEDGWVPINKNLWSISFVLVMAGTAFLAFALLYVLVDCCDVWNGAPVIYPGMNSIVIYVCHSVFGSYFPVSWHVQNVHWQRLALCTWSTAFWLIVAYVLFRKKIFVAI